MPGYVIHLAVAKGQVEKDKIKNVHDFIRGVIAPDLLKKKKKENNNDINCLSSHYGDSSSPNLGLYLKLNDMNSDYNKGYFLHLVTDYFFYKKYLCKWNKNIYEDYDIINRRLIDKFDLEIPEAVKEYISFKEGDLTILNFDDIISFINKMNDLTLKEMYKEYMGDRSNECKREFDYFQYR